MAPNIDKLVQSGILESKMNPRTKKMEYKIDKDKA